FECVTVISLRVINSNPKSIILILHYHLSNLNTLNYLEASDYKDKKMLQLGKLMVCIKRKPASCFPPSKEGTSLAQHSRHIPHPET
ncbi:mCG1029224, partial [Mus musculus]